MTSSDRNQAHPTGGRADPSGTRTVFDPEGTRARQQEQQTGAAIPLQSGGDLEPNDSRVVTGASGSGVGAPGGADQDTGGTRYGAPQAQVHDAGAQQQQQGTVGFKPDPQLQEGGADVEFAADLAVPGRADPRDEKDSGG